MNIDLTGLEDKWSQVGGQICAVCGWNHDVEQRPDPDDPEDHQIPLLLFRGEGSATEMLCLCWTPCAAGRTQVARNN